MKRRSGAQHKQFYRLMTGMVVIAALVCLSVSVWAARQWAGERALVQLRGNAEESLALQIEALTGVMEKYRLIPPLLSKRTDIRTLFKFPGREQAETARLVLANVASASGARDIAIADRHGNVLTSARNLATSETLKRSPLVEAAAQRRLGRAAVRLADGSRAYAFASHVTDIASDTNIGMIVAMVPFYAIEASWSLSSNPIFVTDAREFVFLSNRLDWVGRPWQASEAAPGTEPLSFRADPFVRMPRQGNALFVEAARTIPILGWTMHVLIDAKPVFTARRNAAWFAALAVSLAALIVLVLIARQSANAARMRRDLAQNMRLERTVRDRTAKLSDVNRALRDEIEVRRQTERQLRETQDELVHAAKLAVVGQMSATLSHEYNQPLAAIKTYAGNAMTMVERGKTAGLPDVLDRIQQMVERMSALSKTLLAFSRKPGTVLQPVAVEAAVNDALILVAQKARQAGVKVETDIPPGMIAHSGRLRLSQVIVNLVGNAVDALTGENERAPESAFVNIAARSANGRIVIEIEDNGPGIADQDRDQIFDPFFTTKPVGAGLGLGLSIVDNIVRDLEGSIDAENRATGSGARFVIDLPAGETKAEAAE
jgi:two-component system C4-dicarboxylate transport sensor histidine kinase DctB